MIADQASNACKFEQRIRKDKLWMMGFPTTIADTKTLLVGGITTMVDETKTMVGDTLPLAKR
jgi:hypothetical protein